MSWPYTLKHIAESAPKSCEIFLFTAVYYKKPQKLHQAPNTNCSFAFVDFENSLGILPNLDPPSSVECEKPVLESRNGTVG